MGDISRNILQSSNYIFGITDDSIDSIRNVVFKAFDTRTLGSNDYDIDSTMKFKIGSDRDDFAGVIINTGYSYEGYNPEDSIINSNSVLVPDETNMRVRGDIISERDVNITRNLNVTKDIVVSGKININSEESQLEQVPSLNSNNPEEIDDVNKVIRFSDIDRGFTGDDNLGFIGIEGNFDIRNPTLSGFVYVSPNLKVSGQAIIKENLRVLGDFYIGKDATKPAFSIDGNSADGISLGGNLKTNDTLFMDGGSSNTEINIEVRDRINDTNSNLNIYRKKEDNLDNLSINLGGTNSNNSAIHISTNIDANSLEETSEVITNVKTTNKKHASFLENVSVSSNVDISGDYSGTNLVLEGNVSISGHTTMTDMSLNNIEALDTITTRGTMTVEGNATFNNNITISGELLVKNGAHNTLVTSETGVQMDGPVTIYDLTIGNNLTLVNSSTSFKLQNLRIVSNVDVSQNVNVDGSINSRGNIYTDEIIYANNATLSGLTVNGTSTMNGELVINSTNDAVVLNVNDSNTNISNVLEAHSGINIGSNVKINTQGAENPGIETDEIRADNAEITGLNATTISADNLTTISNITVCNDLNVQGITTFTGNVNATNISNIGDLNVDGETNLNNITTNTLTVVSNAVFQNNATVEGTLQTGIINSTANANFNNVTGSNVTITTATVTNMTVDNITASNTTHTGSVFINENLSINGTINTSNINSTGKLLANDISATTVKIVGTLDLNDAIVSGFTNSNNADIVDIGDITFTNSTIDNIEILKFKSDRLIDPQIDLNGNSNNALLIKNADSNFSIRLGDDSNGDEGILMDVRYQTGVVDLNNTRLVVKGKGVFSNNVDIVNGGLNVDGASVLSNTLNVTGNTTLGGTLNVTGNASLGGTLNVTSNSVFSNQLRVSSGGMDVTGTSTFSNSMAIKSGLDVTGNTTTNGINGRVSGANFGFNLAGSGSTAGSAGNKFYFINSYTDGTSNPKSFNIYYGDNNSSAPASLDITYSNGNPVTSRFNVGSIVADSNITTNGSLESSNNLILGNQINFNGENFLKNETFTYNGNTYNPLCINGRAIHTTSNIGRNILPYYIPPTATDIHFTYNGPSTSEVVYIPFQGILNYMNKIVIRNGSEGTLNVAAYNNLGNQGYGSRFVSLGRNDNLQSTIAIGAYDGVILYNFQSGPDIVWVYASITNSLNST